MPDILFYDGDCGLCNHTVQFMLANEKKNCTLQFCALQSAYAKEALKEKYDFTDLSTFVLLKNNRLYFRSDAALESSAYLKFPFNLAPVFKVVPVFIRDAVYNFIAKRRKKLVKQVFCVIPPSEKKKRFIS